MHRIWVGVVVLCGLVLLAAPVWAADATVAVRAHPQLGPFLTDAQGRTLYKFTRDTENTSNCYDQCAVNWPPFNPGGELSLPAGTGGRLAVIDRRDGTKQVAYNGVPLYYFARDTQPGDTNGQNLNNVWFVVAPVPAGSGPGMPRTGAGGLASGDVVSVGGAASLGVLLLLRVIAARPARRRTGR